MKRAFDIGVSIGALIVCAPLALAIAALVRVSSPGPILYRGRRIGRNGREFEMLKFRTMTSGAPDVRNPDGSTYADPGDPRVTPVGRWLRRTSLDELPQFWNVLRGDMSIVGPRPDLPDQIQYYSPADYRRLSLRPGITGLAQISGRNDLTWSERRALDLHYVDTATFAADIRILLRTVPSVLRGQGVFARPHGKAR